MRSIVLILAAAAVAFGADQATDKAWAKVKELKTGTELRIFKKGAVKAVLAVLDEANDENLIVMVKNEEIAINRDDIDRVDYRPKRAPEGPTVEHHGTERGPEGNIPTPRGQPVGPTVSSGSSVSFGGSKPDFETIYRRPPPAPKKPE